MSDAAKKIADLPADELQAVLQRLLREKGSRRQPSEDRMQVTPVKRDRGRFPVSFAQQGMWLAQRMAPASTDYHIFSSLSLGAAPDLPSLGAALAGVVRRHEALRTMFLEEDGALLQVVRASMEVPLPVVEIAHVPRIQRERALLQACDELVGHPFDLEQGPLLRILLLKLDANDHLVFLCFHHIISDHWTVEIFFRELEALYLAFREGRPSPLAPQRLHYVDYTVAQRRWLRGDVLQRYLDYWKGQLGRTSRVLRLPLDSPRPPIANHAGSRESSFLPPALATEVAELCRAAGITPAMAYLAAFKLLLSRYTGEVRLRVGSPIANRDRPEVQNISGFFVNLLVFASDLGGNPGVRELLGRTKEVCLGAYAHQDMPFEMLVAEVETERELSRHPLFQVAFNFMPSLGADSSGRRKEGHDTREDTGESEPGHLTMPQVVSLFDLTLILNQVPAGFEIDLEYRTDLLERLTVRRMIRHFHRLLVAMVQHPQHRIGQLPLLSAAEQHQLSIAWNDTASAFPADRPLHQLFTLQVGRTPEAVAVVSHDRHLSYRRLDVWADQLADRLRDGKLSGRSRAERPEFLVGLCAGRSPQMVAGLLGILKAGGAYLPLDPSYPEERLRLMIADAGASVVLCESRLRRRLPARTSVVELEKWSPGGGESPVTDPSSAVRSEQIAYVMYTSGSAGAPKGIAVPHRGVVRLVQETDYIEFGPGKVFLQLAPISFDASTFEIWGALLHGSRLVLAPEEPPSLEDLGAMLARERVTTLWLTAGLFQVMVNERLSDLAPVRQLLAGGDVLSQPHVRRVLRELPGTRLINGYGPTEGTTFTCCHPMAGETEFAGSVPIGRPLANTRTYIVDRWWNFAPIGVWGELWIGGDGLARGYDGRPGLSAERFVPDLPGGDVGGRCYRTGDLVRLLADGRLEFGGRIDHQLKIGGFRIEPGEIEAVLVTHPAVREALVVARGEASGDRHLVACLVTDGNRSPSSSELRGFLAEELPAYMVPSAFVFLEAIPLSANGKVDRAALARRVLEGQSLSGDQNAVSEASKGQLEAQIRGIWQEVLQLDEVGRRDNFFELGGTSLLLIQVHHRLQEQLQLDLVLIDLFRFPTISTLAIYLSRERVAEPEPTRPEPIATDRDTGDVAIIGMAGRFPDAGDVDEFWDMLLRRHEAVHFFEDEELRAAGISEAALEDPAYVKARAVLAGCEDFDAGFFEMHPREVEITDPQQRVFLEQAWVALENAACDPERFAGQIGVYAGSSSNSYLYANLLSTPKLLDRIDSLQLHLGNAADFLATRVSYKLDLKGPSVTVSTACSTSLVAVAEACDSLLHHRCDLALAGGVSVHFPQQEGYLYVEGGTVSPDGHCRAFDTAAQGLVPGEAAGVVVLKRLSEALADGDPIHAVIKGAAVNNDGAVKLGFTAPSIDGQAEVIAAALSAAQVPVESIGFVEAHGTGTELGDRTEVAGLTQVFRRHTAARGFCALGSVKTNIGHADAAAGIAGLIKMVQALRHRELPPSLHFREPHPELGLEESPFYVNVERRPWPAPRRGGVSSFGIGGTNAHVVLEEAPEPPSSDPDERPQLLVLSAKTASALEARTADLMSFLNASPEADLADVAFTLQQGRKAFPFRRIRVAKSVAEALSDGPGSYSAEPSAPRSLVMMFSGQGSQHPGMAADLYRSKPLFRHQVDASCRLLEPHLGTDLRTVLYPAEGAEEASRELLDRTELTQPALFVIEHALARCWLEWGLEPHAMIGHSIGEYVAACLAGTLSLEAALALVATRGRWIQSLPAGAMIAVRQPADAAQEIAGEGLDLSAVNGPQDCVISGSLAAIEDFEQQLSALGVEHRRLRTSHAFHSRLLDPILEDFRAEVARVELQPPRIPWVSNVTGTWIREEEACDPDYWVRHLRQPVLFAQGLSVLWQKGDGCLLEVGPGHTLTTLARRQIPEDRASAVLLHSLSAPNSSRGSLEHLTTTLGRLWLAGFDVAWSRWHEDRRRRLSLPTYPFERRRYWSEPDLDRAVAEAPADEKLAMQDWTYLPGWRRTTAPRREEPSEPGTGLIFIDECGLGEDLGRALERRRHRLVRVKIGREFAESEDGFTVAPGCENDYKALFRRLAELGQIPDRILHLWGVTPPAGGSTTESRFRAAQERGFLSLLALVRALDVLRGAAPAILVFTNHLHEITGDEELMAEKATILAWSRVLRQEHPHLRCRCVDLVLPETASRRRRLIERLAEECTASGGETVLAYRAHHRWAESFEPLTLDGSPQAGLRLRHGGHYLVTGGLGRIGLALSELLAQQYGAQLTLISRSSPPPRSEWDRCLEEGEARLARKIGGLRRLEGIGAEFLVLTADAGDREQMSAAVEQAVERYGKIDGVLHAAGTTDEAHFLPIRETDAANVERHLAAKARGLLVLAEVFRDHDADFCLTFSSLGAVLGGLGFISYAAANLFVDAYTQKLACQSDTRWLSVDWDAWQAAEPESDRTIEGLAVEAAEGLSVIERLLAQSDVSRAVVSVGNLQQRIDRWVRLESLAESDGEQEGGRSDGLHPRPELSCAYVAPRHEFEQQIAGIWQELLGVEQVGIHDNYFELGGDSLLAVHLSLRLRQGFGVELAGGSLLQRQTVAEQTLLMLEKLAEETDEELLAELLES